MEIAIVARLPAKRNVDVDACHFFSGGKFKAKVVRFFGKTAVDDFTKYRKKQSDIFNSISESKSEILTTFESF